jgi:hypothetical protein
VKTFTVELNAHLANGSVCWVCQVEAENKEQAFSKAEELFDKNIFGGDSWKWYKSDSVISEK